MEKNLGPISGSFIQNYEVSGLTPGLYLIYMYAGDTVVKELFVKN